MNNKKAPISPKELDEMKSEPKAELAVLNSQFKYILNGVKHDISKNLVLRSFIVTQVKKGITGMANFQTPLGKVNMMFSEILQSKYYSKYENIHGLSKKAMKKEDQLIQL